MQFKKSKKEQKIKIVEDCSSSCSQFDTIIITHYRGLTVNDINNLRKGLKGCGAKFSVIKNTLFKIATSNTSITGVDDMISGPTAIIYSKEPVGACKVVTNFAAANENFKVVGFILDRNVLDASFVTRLSKVPSLNELRATIVGLLNAPATKIVRVLKEPASQIARLLSAYSSK